MTGKVLCQFETLLSKIGKKKLMFNPTAINEWLQDVAKKAYYCIPRKIKMEDSTQRKIKSFTMEQNGPALTFKLTLTNNHQVDLDLVPVFAIRSRRARKLGVRQNVIQPSWLRKTGKHSKEYRMDVFEGLHSDFFVIPKPGPNKLDWGIHFPSAEKKIIKALGCVKPVIRYLKYFRDHHEILSKIKSYALLTIVMQMIRTNRPNFWEQRTSFCILEAFKKLAYAMEAGHLGWFFDEDCNILPAQYYPTEKREEILNFLLNVISELKTNVTFWYKYFK